MPGRKYYWPTNRALLLRLLEQASISSFPATRTGASSGRGTYSYDSSNPLRQDCIV
jgi:hypothetical protein